MNDNGQVQRFWDAYARVAQPADAQFKIVALGDNPELADELVALVIAGAKRATTSLFRTGTPVPKFGDLSILIDGNKTPRCIIRTRQVEVKPIRDVDASFALDEGEGDRSLEWWVAAHKRYFKRQTTHSAFIISDETEVVLERFDVVWPPEFADRPVYRAT